jgi:hypothetical protein
MSADSLRVRSPQTTRAYRAEAAAVGRAMGRRVAPRVRSRRPASYMHRSPVCCYGAPGIAARTRIHIMIGGRGYGCLFSLLLPTPTYRVPISWWRPDAGASVFSPFQNKNGEKPVNGRQVRGPAQESPNPQRLLLCCGLPTCGPAKRSHIPPEETPSP